MLLGVLSGRTHHRGAPVLAASLLLTASGHIDRPPVVNLFGAMIGTESDTMELLDELVSRVGADPMSAFRKHMSYRETKRYLAELGDTMASDDDWLGESVTGRAVGGGSPLQQVGVLPAAASR